MSDVIEPWPVGADAPEVTAPPFGQVPAHPFEPTPERLVLSSEEHQHLAPAAGRALSAEFATVSFGSGFLSVRPLGTGMVHVHADIHRDSAMVQLDADVRESWVERRTLSASDPESAAILARELFALAELPGQRTVNMRVKDGRTAASPNE